MPVTARASLGNSLGGGLWKKISPPALEAGAGVSVDIDTTPFDEYAGVVYYVVVWDDSGENTHSRFMSVSKDSNQPVETVYGRVGAKIKFSLDTALNSGNLVVTLTNNETYNINFDIIRLIVPRRV
jgi:hypothetical protein